MTDHYDDVGMTYQQHAERDAKRNKKKEPTFLQRVAGAMRNKLGIKTKKSSHTRSKPAKKPSGLEL